MILEAKEGISFSICSSIMIQIFLYQSGGGGEGGMPGMPGMPGGMPGGMPAGMPGGMPTNTNIDEVD